MRSRSRVGVGIRTAIAKSNLLADCQGAERSFDYCRIGFNVSVQKMETHLLLIPLSIVSLIACRMVAMLRPGLNL